MALVLGLAMASRRYHGRGRRCDATAPHVAEILAEPPSDLIVTIYRSPDRDSGSIDLDELGGFALVSETRLVHLPAGLSRVRFEGVADGIEPASAIVTGLPGRVVEKNRDARLLSPSALVAAAVGKTVELERTNRKTGKTESVRGTILSDARGRGVSVGRGCRGAALFGHAGDLQFRTGRRPLGSTHLVRGSAEQQRRDSAGHAVLSWPKVLIGRRTTRATLAADGKSLDLGAWVTLANSNGVGFPAAHTQVVAGRVNREDDEVDPIEMGGPILAQCWPRGSTSDASLSTSTNGVQIEDACAWPRRRRSRRQLWLEEVIVTAGKGPDRGPGTARGLEAVSGAGTHHPGQPPIKAGASDGSRQQYR